MSKKSTTVLSSLSQTLPDDRPITSIEVVERIEKCSPGFIPVSKTYDQDQDADLWREHSIFRGKQGRYLCLSKTEGCPNLVVQEIAILTDKEHPPVGFCLLKKTSDTEQKAWRKRQLCYRLSHIKNASTAVTDIIICNKIKQAPTGFTLAGEINGLTICYKISQICNDSVKVLTNNLDNKLKNGKSPLMPSRAPPERPPRTSPANPYPLLEDGDHDYELLNPSYLQPRRPAPKPPTNGTPKNNGYNTLAVYHGLEGVPFLLNPKIASNSKGYDVRQISVMKPRSTLEIEKDYYYDFNLEKRET